MSDSIKICAIGIVCSIICVIVKKFNSELHIPTKITGLIIIYTAVIAIIAPLIEYLTEIMDNKISEESTGLILKAISIAFVTQITSDVCRECGETNLASGIDTVGKIEILLLALPLIDGIIKLSEELLKW